MEKISLTALARQHLESARAASSGRSAHTVYGGHEHSLRQTLIALTAGSSWTTTKAPAKPRCRCCRAGSVSPTRSRGWDGSPGDHIVIPRTRHGLHALEDSVVLLTVVKPVGPHT